MEHNMYLRWSTTWPYLKLFQFCRFVIKQFSQYTLYSFEFYFLSGVHYVTQKMQRKIFSWISWKGKLIWAKTQCCFKPSQSLERRVMGRKRLGEGEVNLRITPNSTEQNGSFLPSTTVSSRLSPHHSFNKSNSFSVAFVLTKRKTNDHN